MEFLAKVMDELARRTNDFSNYVMVTPNRRAGLFIKKYIQENKKIQKPCWIPELYSIKDFISVVSRLYLMDNFSLVFRLYPVYTESFKHPKSFDTFYQWGKLVISDFNEIDLYLVDQDSLFTSLQQITSLDKEFERGGTVIDNFIQFSENLHQLYTKFTTDLLADNQAYYGLALRKIVEEFTLSGFDTWEKVIFAGFNVLSTAEQVLMEKLKENGKAEIFWDIDRYFYDDEKQEAGYFFRKNSLIKNSSPVTWITDELLTSAKNIEIIGTAGRVAQTKVAGEYLDKEIQEKDQTAVVLPDESLLFPLLNSLPENLQQVNVTMGYPLKNTSLYHLLHSIIELQSNKDTSDNKCNYFYRDVSTILLHSYILTMDRKTVYKFLNQCLEENRVLVQDQELNIFTENINYIFTPVFSLNAFIEYFRNILENIVNSMKEREGFSFEIEYIYNFYIQLQKINETMAEFNIELELSTFWNLFKGVIESSSVPFLGEPLQGLQIMGLLETRALDFKNVYILSANEGILPAVRTRNSFIPHDVRKYYGMVTHEHEDSIYAYYFYRLLKQAEKVKIFYNTESNEFGKGERSRFIEQLLREYRRKNSNASVKEKIVNIQTAYKHPETLTIKKDVKIIEHLFAMEYSPTRLQTYVDCSLKFYLKYILRLDQPEEVIESAEAREFGVVIHRILERLYQPFLGSIISREGIEKLNGQYEGICEQAYQEVMGNVDIYRGRNFIYCSIIKTLIKNYVNNEISGKTIIGNEVTVRRNLKVENKEVLLFGKIDRLEKHSEFTDIIDFKTGDTKSLQFTFQNEYNRENLIEILQKKEQVLQLIFYYYLITGTGYITKDTPCRIGIYSFRNQQKKKNPQYLKNKNNDIFHFRGTAEVGKSAVVLKHILADIFNREKSFQQTKDRSKCDFCPYKNVCGR